MAPKADVPPGEPPSPAADEPARAPPDRSPAPTLPRGGDLDPGQRVGPYRVLRKLGQGGMGTVFQAVHEQIERQVAIKVLRPIYSQRPDVAQRFLNEARAVNRVRHPALVQVSDYG